MRRRFIRAVAAVVGTSALQASKLLHSKVLLAVLLAGVFLCTAAPLHAQDESFSFNDVAFEDGGTATGKITFNLAGYNAANPTADPPVVSAIDITTTAGTSPVYLSDDTGFDFDFYTFAPSTYGQPPAAGVTPSGIPGYFGFILESNTLTNPPGFSYTPTSTPFPGPTTLYLDFSLLPYSMFSAGSAPLAGSGQLDESSNDLADYPSVDRVAQSGSLKLMLPPATFQWVGGGDATNWNDGLNWKSNPTGLPEPNGPGGVNNTDNAQFGAFTFPDNSTSPKSVVLSLSGPTPQFNNLTVANGSLTLASGQINANGAVNVGSPSGIGTLTIDGGTQGGTIVTGAAVIDYFSTVNVTGGLSQWTIAGQLSVGPSSASALTIQNGGEVSDGSAVIATGSTVTVEDATWNNTGSLNVGASSVVASLFPAALNVNGGLVNSGSAVIDYGGIVTISGEGAWNNAGTLLVGSSGSSGTLNVLSGGKVTTGPADIAYSSNVIVGGSSGETHSQFNVVDDTDLFMSVGDVNQSNPAGTLTVNSGGIVSDGQVDIDDGTVIVNGGQWTTEAVNESNGFIFVGVPGPVPLFGSPGLLTVMNGGSVSSVGAEIDYGSSVTVTGTSSQWTMSGLLGGLLLVGANGGSVPSTLNIENGGSVSDVNALITSGSTVSVEGNGSWTNTALLTVGSIAGAGALADPSGSLTIDSGGEVADAQAVVQNGTVTVDGGSWITIPNGNNGNGEIYIGSAEGDGTLNIQSTGILLSSNVSCSGAAIDGSNVTVSGQESIWQLNGGQLNIGTSGASTAACMLSIQGGGSVSDGTALIASGSKVTVDGTGSMWQNADLLSVGLSGITNTSGSLTITGGGKVTDAQAVIQNGTVNINGGTWTTTANGANGNGVLYVGSNSLSGQLYVLGGDGTVTSADGVISYGSSVAIVGLGSTWAMPGGTLTVGANGPPSDLEIEQGGSVSDGTAIIASTSTVFVGGGPNNAMWSTTGDLNVGNSNFANTAGMLTVNPMGTVTDAQASIGGGTVYINVGGIWTTTASASNGNGFIYVGNDGLAGTLTVVSGGTVNCGALVVDLASIVNVTGSLDVGYNPAAGSAGGGLFISQAESGPPSGSMTIQGGSAVNSGPGQIDNGGSVTVSDSNSSWSVGGGLSVGSQSDGSLTIQNGGLVKVTGTAVVAALAGVVGSSGTVLVEDTNSLFACSDLDVGGTDTAAGGVGVFRLTEDASAQVGSVLNIWGNGTVDVAGGAMTVGSKVTLATIGQILINSGGTVKGNGTVVASAGIPIEVAEGGILAPGSPGALKIVQPNFVHVDDDVTNDLTIDGDFQDDPGGTLDMQITGADAADYGHLTVTGTSDIQGSVLLDFMDGFGPQTGDVYDLFSFDGGANDFSGDIQVMGLAPGWLYQIEQVGDEEEIESLNNGTATTPEPASAAWLLAAGLLLRQRRYERCRGPKLVA